MTESKHADSLKSLQESLKHASSEFELLIAKFNLAICRYNLDLPTQTLISEIEELLTRFPQHPLRERVEQIKMMEMKRLMLAGRFQEILEVRFPHLTQGLYLQAWLESLPWSLTSLSQPRLDFIDRALGEEDYFQKKYRLQTLLADSRMQGLDETETTLQLQVDRLYLWTWMWLDKPDSAIRELLERELQSFPFERAHLALTSEDFYLLESAGGWLGLFNPEFARGFSNWLKKYAPTRLPESAFFTLDRQCRESFPVLPPQSSAELTGYLRFLERLGQQQKTANAALSIDLASHTLVGVNGTLVSPPGSRLLSALKSRGSVSFADALGFEFSIPDYDEWIHAPKIHNLLQRLKPLLPASVELRTKNQRIYLRDASSEIAVLAGSPHQRHFPKFHFPDFEKRQTVQRERRQKTAQESQLVLAFHQRPLLTRLDIQNELSVSKATANRLIANWLKSGLLRLVSSGRVSTYELETD